MKTISRNSMHCVIRAINFIKYPDSFFLFFFFIFSDNHRWKTRQCFRTKQNGITSSTMQGDCSNALINKTICLSIDTFRLFSFACSSRFRNRIVPDGSCNDPWLVKKNWHQQRQSGQGIAKTAQYLFEQTV